MIEFITNINADTIAGLAALIAIHGHLIHKALFKRAA